MSAPLPPVLKSWKHLLDNASDLESGGPLPIIPLGSTYNMAQEITWLDSTHFGVGRWDGSMSIFQFNASREKGPVIVRSINSPSAEGVQMITRLTDTAFVTSNNERSMVSWQSSDGQWANLIRSQLLEFPETLGVANSGIAFEISNRVYLVSGHANGFLAIWSSDQRGINFELVNSMNIQGSNPANPWNIHNIREVSLLNRNDNYGYVITGSEDGDLCIVRIPDGVVLSRTRFNPKAQRGINSLAVWNNLLLVANCSVGPTDNNLWLYSINYHDWSIQLRHSINLKVNATQQQVFNFDIIWGTYSEGVCWFSTTEEGYLWMGSIREDLITVIGKQQLAAQLGAAAAITPDGRLAVAAYDLHEFYTSRLPDGLTEE